MYRWNGTEIDDSSELTEEESAVAEIWDLVNSAKEDTSPDLIQLLGRIAEIASTAETQVDTGENQDALISVWTCARGGEHHADMPGMCSLGGYHPSRSDDGK